MLVSPSFIACSSANLLLLSGQKLLASMPATALVAAADAVVAGAAAAVAVRVAAQVVDRHLIIAKMVGGNSSYPLFFIIIMCAKIPA